MRCQGCPAPGPACPGEYHARLCELRIERPEYARMIAAPCPQPVSPDGDPELPFVLLPDGPEPAHESHGEAVPGPTPAPAGPTYIYDALGRAYDTAVLARIPACPQRGANLTTIDPSCGCSGPELHECRAGRGATPGRVTTRECYDCRAEATQSLQTA